MRALSTRRRSGGFTLLEILVALAIVTVVLASLVNLAAQASHNAGYLERKTLAHWVAMNRMSQLQATRAHPPKGRKQGKEMLAGIEWQWRQSVKPTPDRRVVQVEFVVGQGDEPRLAVLTGYFPSGQ